MILGKNGTGKSSFLQAFQFALSDQFKKLSKQEKRKFLRQGSQEGIFAVEITFDNSERRVPVEADELRIRKAFNTQTDREEYQLNGKQIKEKDLFNLFESGGLALHQSDANVSNMS